MKRHSSNWKSVERKVAKKLGGMRIPLSGRNNMGKIGDVELTGYHVECKSGRQIPKSVTGWLETLRQLPHTDSDKGLGVLFGGEIPVLVLQPFHLKEQIVVLTLTDFSKLVKAAHGATLMAD